MNWSAIGVVAAITVPGVYVILAAEMGWPLPGKKRSAGGDTPAVNKIDETLELFKRLVEAVERLERRRNLRP